jgi:hypothetical protein
MTRGDRNVLAALVRAHQLTFRERRFCRRLARLYGLDGSGGPGTSPAMLFLRPSFWDVFRRDAEEAPDRRLPPAEIDRMKARLFGAI